MCLRIAALFVACLASAAQVQQAGPGVHFNSKEKEARLGAILADEVRRKTTAIDNEAVRGYVERIGTRLSTGLPAAGFPYTFTMITDHCGPGISTHEPLALPGGHVFIPSGLILAAREEAELAGMLAHAMAHVAERHGARIAARGALVNPASMPLVFVGGWSGTCGSESAVPMSVLSSQREFELQADRLAAGAMSAAGYDPPALVRYISRVQPVREDQSDPLPARAARIASLEEAIRELPAKSYLRSDDLSAIREEVRRLVGGAVRPPSLRRPPSLQRDDRR